MGDIDSAIPHRATQKVCDEAARFVRRARLQINNYRKTARRAPASRASQSDYSVAVRAASLAQRPPPPDLHLRSLSELSTSRRILSNSGALSICDAAGRAAMRSARLCDESHYEASKKKVV
jgi:hypothetical protein